MPYKKIQNRTNLQNNPTTQSKRNRLFLDFNYHPSDIPRYTIRKIYEDELMDVLNQELYPDTKVTVCYSCPKSIQDIVAKAALFQVERKEVSKNCMAEL